MDRSLLRLDGQDPYLCLHFVIIFVRDQERSLRFYVDKLGFRVVVDQRLDSGVRWVEVAPPDGSGSLALALSVPGTEAEKFVGRETQIYFITEDVTAKFNQWSSRGVRFPFRPDCFPNSTPSVGERRGRNEQCRKKRRARCPSLLFCDRS
jgi:phosphoserine phosphatase RsbU/P